MFNKQILAQITDACISTIAFGAQQMCQLFGILLRIHFF